MYAYAHEIASAMCCVSALPMRQSGAGTVAEHSTLLIHAQLIKRFSKRLLTIVLCALVLYKSTSASGATAGDSSRAVITSPACSRLHPRSPHAHGTPQNQTRLLGEVCQQGAELSAAAVRGSASGAAATAPASSGAPALQAACAPLQNAPAWGAPASRLALSATALWGAIPEALHSNCINSVHMSLQGLMYSLSIINGHSQICTSCIQTALEGRISAFSQQGLPREVLALKVSWLRYSFSSCASCSALSAASLAFFSCKTAPFSMACMSGSERAQPLRCTKHTSHPLGHHYNGAP